MRIADIQPVFNPAEEDPYVNRFSDWQEHPCYYVSVVNGKRWNVLAGPFLSHRQALDMVEATRKEAEKIDPYAHFYSFGTVKMANGHRNGLLSERLRITGC
jgi:hypothetical protein